MKHIKKFNEDIEMSDDYSKYHIISDEDITDICLEMTDIGFVVDIRKFFINEDGSKTNNPITNTAYPIYDISLSKESDFQSAILWDGSYYYDTASTSASFTSVLNKMKKVLPVMDARYCVANEKYRIRLILDQISVDKVGFDFTQFSKKVESKLKEMKEDDDRLEIISFMSSNDSLVFEIFTDGYYNTKWRRSEIWENKDEFDNKDQYEDIIREIDSFLIEYSRSIRYIHEFNSSLPYKREDKVGFLRKKIKIYNRYKMGYVIESKSVKTSRI